MQLSRGIRRATGRRRSVKHTHRNTIHQTRLRRISRSRGRCRSSRRSGSRCRRTGRSRTRRVTLRQIIRRSRTRGVNVHGGTHQQTDHSGRHQRDSTLHALCRIGIDRAVGSAARSLLVHLVKLVAGIAHGLLNSRVLHRGNPRGASSRSRGG